MFKISPPARKQYPEDPAEFKPLTEDELQRIKKERRQKDLQRKQKAAENRKHLANVRVVQKNLVFVVGLSQRLADPEALKRHDYFGKFGKIHKVVINQSTSYAGAQGPSASAYVTYNKPEDALKAIQVVNNIHVDGRTLKASLGTTKYCSHFLRGAQCPKPDCMYLHELGEETASFTKEEMQQGKHQEYEQKLYETYMNTQNLTNHQVPTTPTTTKAQTRKKTGSPQTIQSLPSPGTTPPNTDCKEAWPSLQSGGGNSSTSNGGSNSNNGGNGGRPERLTNGNKSPHSPHGGGTSNSQKPETENSQNRAPGQHRNRHSSGETEQTNSQPLDTSPSNGTQNNRTSGQPLPQLIPQQSPHNILQQQNSLPTVHSTQQQSPIGTTRKSPFENPADSMSLFSNGFPPTNRNPKPPQLHHPESITTPEIPDTMPVSSTTDWQAAFGFTSNTAPTPTVSSNPDMPDDDLGFDPWDESTRALADLIEKESGMNVYSRSPPLQQQQGIYNQVPPDNLPKNLPPGFSPNHIGAYNGNLARPGLPGGSKLMGPPMQQFPGMPPPSLHTHNTYHDMLSDIPNPAKDNIHVHNNPQNDAFSTKDWQDGLRALLPNINISFGGANGLPNNSVVGLPNNSVVRTQQQTHVPQKSLSESPPHWMASLQHLTEDGTNNHRLPFVHQFQFRGPSWPPQTQHPPPGFQTQIRPPTQVTETHKLAEGLQ